MNYSLWQWIFLITLLLPEAIFDIRKKEIHPVLIFMAALIAEAVNILFVHENLICLLMNPVVGAALFAVSFIYSEGIGKGDAIVCLFVGCVVGFEYALSSLFTAFLLAAIFSLIMLAGKRAELHTRMPFVPFIGLATILTGVITI